MTLGRVSDHRSSGFFAPKDHMTTLALLVEPKSIEYDVPNTFKGKASTRNEVLCDISIFANQADIDAKTPSNVLKRVKVHHTMLTKSLVPFLPDGAALVRLGKIDTENGSGYVFDDVNEDDVRNPVIEYMENRAAAAAAAPSFD